MSRQASAFILIPALMAGSWWLGLRTARWERDRHPAPPFPVETVESRRLSPGSAGNGGAEAMPEDFWEKADAAVCAAAWRDLRPLPPESQNRWRALRLFRRWAQVDPAGALRELEADTPVESRIWPAAEAARRFWMILAEADPDKAWHLAAEQRDPAAAVNAMATALAARQPQAVLASSADAAIRLVAKARLAEPATDIYDDTDEVRQIQMHRLLTQPLTADLVREADDMIGGSEETEHVLAWRRELAGRLLERPEAEVLAALSGTGQSSYVTGQLLLMRASTLPPGKLLAELSANDGYGLFVCYRMLEPPQIARQLTAETLTYLITHSPPPPEFPVIKPHYRWPAVTELLWRDPGSVPPMLRPLAQSFDPNGMPYFEMTEPPMTRTMADAVKEIITLSPDTWLPRLLDPWLPVLAEFDPAFAMDRIAAFRNAPHHEQEQADPFARYSSNPSFETHGLLSAWLDRDTEAASAWIRAHPESLARMGMTDVVRKWADQNPEAASRWTDDLPPGELKNRAITGLVIVMKDRDPGATSAWLERIFDPDNPGLPAYPASGDASSGDSGGDQYPPSRYRWLKQGDHPLMNH